jgi:hypothetical protein
MSPEVIENTLVKHETIANIVKLRLDDAHICGGVNCRTISNCDGVCPGCLAPTSTLVHIVENPINVLAHEIALDHAKTDIWSHTNSVSVDGVMWHDTTSIAGRQERADVKRAVRYLDGVGALIRYRENCALVRWE